ncbi:MAG: phenylacetate--CoA ligase family protein [Thermoplasmata archaeon]|nr:MAG: phenylacetate--CoA ligase family protein [Thermoplasmata archaeon]
MRSVVKNLPYPIKLGLKYAYGMIPLPIRYGKVFRDTYAFLQESQWWSREKLEEYQIRQLNKLLHHAYENVPYYRRVFEERGLRPENIQDFDDLRKLPYLTKDIVRENLSDLLAQNYSKSKLRYATTGGTTGMPLGFYWEKGFTDSKEWAFVWRQWNWAGYRFGKRRVTLRGDVISKFKRGQRKLWEYDRLNNVLFLSPYDMTEENLFKYVGVINKFRPVAIQGYPSNLYILAHFLKNNNLRIDQIKCILTSSEILYAHQREIIEESLTSRIYDHYGNSERNALVVECEEGIYHIIQEYGILESIGSDGNSTSKEDDIGEIVATGFNNYAMPFVRYKTGDLAVYTKHKCACGRNYPLLKRIEGRSQEFIVTKQASLVSLGPAIFGIHDLEWTRVRQIQFVQEQKGKLIIKIVKNDNYSDQEIKEYVLKLFNIRLSRICDLFIEIVDDIPRTKRGKYRVLIQELPVEFESNESSLQV